MRYFAAAALLCTLLVVPVLAAPRDDVLAGISRCGAISDDRNWLDCVYGAAQPMRAQLGLAPAPAAQQKLVPPPRPGAPALQAFAPPPPPARAERPGFFTRMITHTVEQPEPPTRLASYTFDAAGIFTVSLANGEVWRQDIGDAARARWTKPAAGYVAQILPSSSDYHLLRVDSQTFMVNKR